jgi:hypothetical protein
MNVFNRILLVLIALVVATAAVSLIAVMWSIPTHSIDGLRDAIDWLERNNTDAGKGVVTAIAAGVGLLSFLLVLLEFKPQTSTQVKLTDLQGGAAMLSTAAIAQRVEEAVAQVPHVSQVRASIKTKKKGVIVSLDLHVDPDANLAAVTDEACAAARDTLTNRVHVALIEPPRCRLHYRELRLRGRQAPTRRLPETSPPDAWAREHEAVEARDPETVAAGVASGEAPAEERRAAAE